MKSLITLLLALSAFALQAFARTATSAPVSLSPQEARCVIAADLRADPDARLWRLETLAAVEEPDEASCASAQLSRRCLSRT